MFDWPDYFVLARMLAGEDIECSPEARQRCAISRAYYAVVCHARNYLEIYGREAIPTDGTAHAEVPKQFARHHGDPGDDYSRTCTGSGKLDG